MVKNDALDLVGGWLLRRNLGEAVNAMENFLATHPHQLNTDRLFSIKTDYQLMAGYWRRGFKDGQLVDLYNNLLQKMYALYADTSVSYGVRHSYYLTNLSQQVNGTARDWSAQWIKSELEAFVSNVAMLTLEPAHTAAVKRRELYASHYRLMTSLFGYILTSGMWSDGVSQSMEDILLLPTIDNNDQQLLVSSIMLSTMEHFDIAKFRLLINVYRNASDENVRQRALVGWVFSLDAGYSRQLFPEAIRLVEEVLENEASCAELVELQMQIIYCINAERDNATIQQEIMPDLLKGQGFRITRNGLMEEEEDAVHDMLHPDEAEQNLERMEASFHRMMDMQKQGSDIYFAGFSQMKSFPFFQELSNWFVPFYMDHPAVTQAFDQMGYDRILNTIIVSGPFCNSDKYSFLFAFRQVMGRLPQNLREAMDEGAAAIEQVSKEEMANPTYIRRIYLQDLYRFFRICYGRKDFKDIFAEDGHDYLFMANEVFSKTQLELRFNEVTAFMIKKKRLTDALNMLFNYGAYRRDYQFYMMAGFLAKRGYKDLPTDENGEMLTERLCYQHALALQPDQERALAGYGRALFDDGLYQEALEIYDKLLTQQPDKKEYMLNKAVCLMKLQRFSEAQRLLFRLNYENADDLSVKRVLAWALTCDGKYQQAENLYGQLLAVGKPLMDDLLNYGYCLWFCGEIDAAIDCFHRYLTETEQEAEYILDNEKELIVSKGITEPEMQMMINAL